MQKLKRSLALAALLLTAAFQQAFTPKTDVPAHPWDLILARPTDKSVTASLLAYKDSEAFIEYGTTSGSYPNKTTVKQFTKDQASTILLSGLAANTRHYYRLQIRDAGTTSYTASQEFSFMTKRPVGSAFVFTIQADSHLDENTDPAIYAQALANMRADQPDFMVDLGDTFMVDKYGNSTYKDSAKHYLAQRYYLGLLCTNAPLLLTLGNHDGEQGRFLNNTADNMTIWSNMMRKTLFPNPVPDGFYTGNSTPDPIAGLPENYFGWEWGDALFLVLDPFWKTNRTNNSDGWAWTLGDAQYQWLKRTLETSQAKYKFVFLHHLVGGKDSSQRGGVEAAKYFEWGGFNLNDVNEFAAKRPGWPMPIHQLLVANKVSAVFHGHDHLYVKQDLDGIVYQEVPQPGFPRINVPASAVEYGYVTGVLLGSPGHLRVTVAPDKAKVELVRPVLAKDETATKKNGEIGHSYEIQPATAVAAATTVSAASFKGGTIAPDSIASVFGTALATSTKAASATPLPSVIDGTTVKVKDSANVERSAPLFFVSPGQINYQIPPGSNIGTATVSITANGNPVGLGTINVASVAPGFFTADSSGQGYPAAVVYRYRNNALVSVEPVARFDAVQNKVVAVPIDLGSETDSLFLIAFSTGVRYRSGLNNVAATIGGTAAEVLFAGVQGDFVGVDQINLRLPRTLAGRGDVDLNLTVDGAAANTVKLNFAATTNSADKFSVTTGEATDGKNSSVIAACTSSVRFFQGQTGTVKSADGTTWTVPAAVNEGAACTDIFNDCTGTGDDPNYLSKLKTTVIDPDGVEITGWFFGDNYFELYVNGHYVCRDSIGFIPFNSSAARFKVKYPITYAIRLVDWETHLGLGMEYDTWNVGDGGFTARFSDGTVTNGNWKTQVFYVAPLDNPNCIGANRNTSTCASRPACAGSDPNKCQAVHYALPANWNSPGFDDSSWPTATIYTANQVTNQPAYTRYTQLFGNASFIWSRNLFTDNHVIARYTVPRAPTN